MVCLFSPCRMQIVGVPKKLSFSSQHTRLDLQIPHSHILSLPVPGRLNLVNDEFILFTFEAQINEVSNVFIPYKKRTLIKFN